jgi:hypothetical protein
MGSPIALMTGGRIELDTTLSSGTIARRARRKNTLFAGHDEGGNGSGIGGHGQFTEQLIPCPLNVGNSNMDVARRSAARIAR